MAVSSHDERLHDRFELQSDWLIAIVQVMILVHGARWVKDSKDDWSLYIYYMSHRYMTLTVELIIKTIKVIAILAH